MQLIRDKLTIENTRLSWVLIYSDGTIRFNVELDPVRGYGKKYM